MKTRKPSITRRDFLSASASSWAAAAAFTPAVACATEKRSATDTVVLGKTGLKLSRLGLGLGSHGGAVQRDLGQDGFNKLVRYAFDQGIRYFDCAQSYKTFQWLGDAVKGLPRDEIFLLSKISGNPDKPEGVIEQQLKILQTDYLDCMLVHCAYTATWAQDRNRLMTALDKAKATGKIRSKGVSCHSLPALRIAAQSDWVEVNLVRVNPQGQHIDGEAQKGDVSGTDIDPVMTQIALMKKTDMASSE